jgi:MFS family permease
MTTQQHPPSEAHPADRHDRRGWLLAAAVVLVLGVLVAGAWSAYGVLTAWRAPEGFARTTLPGTVSVHVSDAGTQWLYYEHPAGAPAPSLEDLRVRVVSPSGRAVASETTTLTVRYDVGGGDLATAVGTFAAATPGTYTVTASGPPHPGAALAVGPDVADPLWTPLLGAAAVLGLCFMTSVGLVLAGLGRRPA